MAGASALGRCPTHTEIIECLHRLSSTGSELHFGSGYHFGSCYISVADVYSAAPDNLVAQHAQPASYGGHGGPYYFLSPVHRISATRFSRTIADKGRWRTEAGRKRVKGTAGGYISTFSYQEKTSSGDTEPGGWVMVEYSIDSRDDLVIAKISRSPRCQATNVPPCTAVSLILQQIESFLMSDDDDAGAGAPAAPGQV